MDSETRSSAARERAAAMGIEQTPAASSQSSKQPASSSTNTTKTASKSNVPVSSMNHLNNYSLEKLESIDFQDNDGIFIDIFIL